MHRNLLAFSTFKLTMSANVQSYFIYAITNDVCTSLMNAEILTSIL